jgi:hypothetical protein
VTTEFKEAIVKVVDDTCLKLCRIEHAAGMVLEAYVLQCLETNELFNKHLEAPPTRSTRNTAAGTIPQVSLGQDDPFSAYVVNECIKSVTTNSSTNEKLENEKCDPSIRQLGARVLKVLKIEAFQIDASYQPQIAELQQRISKNCGMHVSEKQHVASFLMCKYEKDCQLSSTEASKLATIITLDDEDDIIEELWPRARKKGLK